MWVFPRALRAWVQHTLVCIIMVRPPGWGEGHRPSWAPDTPEQREEATVSLGSGAWGRVHNPDSCLSQPWVSASTNSTPRRACSQPGCVPHPDRLYAARLCPSWPSPAEDQPCLRSFLSPSVMSCCSTSDTLLASSCPLSVATFSKTPGLRTRPPLQPLGQHRSRDQWLLCHSVPLTNLAAVVPSCLPPPPHSWADCQSTALLMPLPGLEPFLLAVQLSADAGHTVINASSPSFGLPPPLALPGFSVLGLLFCGWWCLLALLCWLVLDNSVGTGLSSGSSGTNEADPCPGGTYSPEDKCFHLQTHSLPWLSCLWLLATRMSAWAAFNVFILKLLSVTQIFNIHSSRTTSTNVLCPEF